MRTLLLAGIFVASCGVALAQPQPHLVIDLNTTTASDSAGPEPMGELGGAFLFEDGYATVRGLWTTNGTAASTSLLLPLPPPFTGGALLSGGTVVNNAFLFGISPAYDVPPPPNTHAGLWRTDGTAAGTARINAIGLYPPTSSSNIFDTTSWNGAAYFGAFPTPTPQAIPSQVWRSDGTPEGAVVLADGHVSPAGLKPSQFTRLPNGVIFTIGEYAANPYTVWRTDGTPEGTRQVTSIPCFQLTRVGARAFMTCEDPATGRELWVTDGTEATTRLVKDLEPGPIGFYPESLVDVDGTLFFTRFAIGSLGYAMQLWKSDGTEAGTVLVKDGFSDGLFFDPHLTPSGRSLYFIGYTTAAGHELWRSDGTTDGTVMVRDIVFGPGDGMKIGLEGSLLAAVPGGLVFTTTTPATGMELWRSSGTQASTVPYNEIEPGPNGSDPRFIRTVGSHVYLDAFQTGTGRELWAVDLAPLVNIGDASVVESDAGTVAATFPVSLTDPVASPVTVFYTTTSGTATAGVDYQPAVGTLTFDRSVGPQMVTVPVNGDLKDEPTETFTVELETIQGPVFPGRSIGLGAIVDNDSPTVTAANATVTEGNAGTTPATFTLTLTTKDGLPAPTDKRVHFATESVTASDLTDFVAQAGTVTFPPGTPSGGTASVAVSVRGDTVPEPDESFHVRFQDLGDAVLADTQVTGHIVNDDGVEHGAAVELTHGSVVRATLEPLPGRAADLDWYAVLQAPSASYEVVVDEVSGDAVPLLVERVASDGLTVLQSASVVGTGSSVSLRWQNFSTAAVGDESVRISSPTCGTACGADDGYRLRFYETSLSAPRFNQTGGQSTVIVLQNPTGAQVNGRLQLWVPEGWLLFEQPFGIAGHGSFLYLPPPSFGAGTLTVSQDGPYGALVGKAVALQPSTGFSFDTPFTYRPR